MASLGFTAVVLESIFSNRNQGVAWLPEPVGTRECACEGNACFKVIC